MFWSFARGGEWDNRPEFAGGRPGDLLDVLDPPGNIGAEHLAGPLQQPAGEGLAIRGRKRHDLP